MQVANRAIPNERQMNEVLEGSHDGPIYMLNSTAYQDIVVHCDAALAGQLNIETVDSVGAWLMQ